MTRAVFSAWIALLLLAASATGGAARILQQQPAASAALGYGEQQLSSGRGLLQANANCTRVHPACSSCRNQRIAGTRRTEMVCSVCATGWRLRRDGKGKICGE